MLFSALPEEIKVQILKDAEIMRLNDENKLLKNRNTEFEEILEKRQSYSLFQEVVIIVQKVALALY